MFCFVLCCIVVLYWHLHHHFLAHVTMLYASVDAGRKRYEDDDQWCNFEMDTLGMPARLLPDTLQCCRVCISAVIEGKLCGIHVHS